MSNRRKARPQPRPDHGWLNDTLEPLYGAEIPGGCDHCDAFQVVKATALGQRGLSVIEVHHDDWCPVLRTVQAR
jgi:hypothetical protein